MANSIVNFSYSIFLSFANLASVYPVNLFSGFYHDKFKLKN